MNVDEVLAKMDTLDTNEEEIQYIIDENLRVISIPPLGVVLGVEGDKDVNSAKFKMVRYYKGIDLSKFEIRINFANANGDLSYYTVKNPTVTDDTLTFEWLVGYLVTKYKGTVRFVVRMITTDASTGEVRQAFDTTVGEARSLEGLLVDTPTDEKVYDIVAQLKADLTDHVNNLLETIPEDYNELTKKVEDNTSGISKLKEDLENITGSVEQLFDVSKVEDGYINSEGLVSSIGEYYHTYIPCYPSDEFYVNYIADNLTITFFDSNKTFIKSIQLKGNKIVVPNNEGIAYISIPVNWCDLYSIIISKNPSPINSGGLQYGNTEYFYNLASIGDFIEVLKSESDYDEMKFEIAKNHQNSLISTKNTSLDNESWINFIFNTIDLVMSYNGGFISIAENDKYIIAFQPSVKKIIRLNKNDAGFTYLTDEISTYNIRHKKINVSMYGGVFKIKDYFTDDVYVIYDVSDLISDYNIISLGIAYVYGAIDYNDMVLCSIFDTSDFIKETSINDKQLETNQWYGKIWYAYGTSLTNTSSEGKYAKYVEQFSGMNRVNKGISGGAICTNKMIKNAVMNTTDGKTNADLITLEVGANDTDATLGSIYDTGDDTFCGALNQCIRYLQENTNAQIVVISSTNARYEPGNPSDLYTPNRQFGTDKHTKYDQWKAIEKVCELNSVYYIPMGEGAGLGFERMISSNKYNVDQIHHTELGGYILGKFVWSRLKDVPLWYTEIPTN